MSGFVWSHLVARIAAGEPCPPSPSTTPLDPQPLQDHTYTGPLTALPDMDLGEDPPALPPARPYDEQVVLPGSFARRVWCALTRRNAA